MLHSQQSNTLLDGRERSPFGQRLGLFVIRQTPKLHKHQNQSQHKPNSQIKHVSTTLTGNVSITALVLPRQGTTPTPKTMASDSKDGDAAAVAAAPAPAPAAAAAGAAKTGAPASAAGVRVTVCLTAPPHCIDPPSSHSSGFPAVTGTCEGQGDHYPLWPWFADA